MTDPYVACHGSPQDPGDSRSTSTQSVRDESLEGELSGQIPQLLAICWCRPRNREGLASCWSKPLLDSLLCARKTGQASGFTCRNLTWNPR